jgi:hypothetical protein
MLGNGSCVLYGSITAFIYMDYIKPSSNIGISDQLNDNINSLLSTDHELIHAKNASLAAMQGSASGNNVR